MLNKIFHIDKNSKILVSACLAGEKCRYDGKDSLNERIKKLVSKGHAVTVCPELLGGLPLPRIPSEIVSGDGSDVLNGTARIINREGEDVTEFFITGAEKVLHIAKKLDITCAILKSRSPSCGSGEIYDGTFTGKLKKGSGVTTVMLEKAGVTLLSDEDFYMRMMGFEV